MEGKLKHVRYSPCFANNLYHSLYYKKHMNRKKDYSIDGFEINGKYVTLEKRADNLYAIRIDGITKEIATTEKAGREKFLRVKQMLEGGEEEMPSKKVDEQEEETAISVKQEKALETLPEDYFQDNVNVGLSDIGVEDIPIPSLSVIQKSSKMTDAEGRPFIPGRLYYKALKQAYEVVDCHILTISKKDLPSFEDRNVLERTYVFLGCIMPTMMPFLMYNKSTSYFAARQFIGEVKVRKFPMYALKVQISTEKRSNDQGDWFVPVFNIVGKETNPDLILQLENLAKEYELNKDMVKSEEEVQPVVKSSERVQEAEEVVDPNDVPF